ncbi:MAG: formylglycine-generating enzyme family protein [Treponema sp.]|jgi:formylglycine-generating enzyme required for sulfatase activity|nr:formylglycine-generating enzyme family protein [Treponema sp.]
MEKQDMKIKGICGIRFFCVLWMLTVLSPALRAQTGLPVMVRVEGGTFLMGGEPGGAGGGAHEVTLSTFFLAEAEVTQALWKEVMGNNPSRFTGDDRPVDSASWLDAVGFCNALSEKAGLPPAYEIAGNTVTWRREAGGYRLPTESEWEYAARGGINGVSGQALYAGGEKPEDVGWYDGNSGKVSHPVKGKAPNGLGLYDMSGNLWEWCWDYYGEYPRQAVTDPSGPAESPRRVLRGGAWFTPVNLLRVTYRYWNSPGFKANSVGFRLARNG